jgi:hypothetical protein
MTLPLLIMHGTDDKATVCKGSQFFYARLDPRTRR